MTQVALGSMFRDSTSYLPRYFEQVEALRTMLEDRGDRLRVIAIENDSADETWEMIDRWLFGHFADGVLVKVHDDCPYFPSVDRPERWRHHAWVQNHVLEELDDTDDVLVYVESDLVWTPDDLCALVDKAKDNQAWTAAVFYREYGGHWYDSWGTSVDGANFFGSYPYHPKYTGEPMQIDTCASVLACPAKLARETRFSPVDAFKGWARDIYAHGGEVWLDPSVAVLHP